MPGYKMPSPRAALNLGGIWREHYCTSPIWRFALSAGSCGPVAYAGILMPSVDRVGRYYPLVIAVPLAAEYPLFVLSATADGWFHQAERLALMGLDLDRLDLDDFSRQVASAGRTSGSGVLHWK
jgi:type VI secretion system protein ImpM